MCLQLPWRPLLTEEDLRRGMYFGSGLRLRRVAQKLLGGQPITFVAVGGSITNADAFEGQGTSYPARFAKFIKATFPNP